MIDPSRPLQFYQACCDCLQDGEQLETSTDITLMCVRRHGTLAGHVSGPWTRGHARDVDCEDTCGHLCVRSLDSCRTSDSNLSFCLCDWSTRDTRDHHCQGLFLVQTFLSPLNQTSSGGGGDLTNQNLRGEGGGRH